MVATEILWPLVIYAAVMTITPGPNNLLLLSSGLSFGLSRTGWHMAGILCGMLLLICMMGAGLGVVFARFPELQTFLKLMGTLYMLWLAQRLWNAVEIKAVSNARPMGFGEAMLFQFVNPKAWVMATTVIAAFVPAGTAYTERVVTAALIYTCIALPCITIWAASGSLIRRWVHDPVTLRRINRVMALLAAATVVLFWL